LFGLDVPNVCDIQTKPVLGFFDSRMEVLAIGKHQLPVFWSLEDIEVVEQRLQNMVLEKKHPWKRHPIKTIRLERLQSRKTLE